MTNTIHAYGELLKASESDRTLRYKLLPFGEKSGVTNQGSFTARKGAVKIPSDISHLIVNTDHKQENPIGRFVSVEEADDALYATIHISEFERGDEALHAALTGEMSGISIEVRRPVIRSGVLVSGEMTGAALTPTPSMASALLMAAEIGELPDTEDSEAQEIPDAEATTAEAEEAEATTITPEKEDNMSENTAAPAAEFLAASASGATSKSALEEFSEMLAEGASFGAPAALHAALTDITKANSYDKTAVPAYVGELYQTGRNYSAKYSVLLGQKPLVATTIKGWKFNVLPQVAYDYAGFPAEIGTNSPTVTEVTATAAQLAGGHTLDRLTLTLNDGGYVAAYLRECTDDFERKLDTKALDFIDTTATAVTGVGGTAYDKLLKGAQLIAETGTPEWAIVGADLWLELMKTTDTNKLALIGASIGLSEGAFANFRLVPAPLSRTSLNGKIIIGTSKAAEMYTLPGGPVRVNAADVSRNGEVNGVWGAYAFLEHDKRELIKVS
ncbi:hypothetical protein ACFUOZ_04650 [Paenarthrobacter sp. NPDC057355]|uniref:hypothetical protein n=1 Tax=Paenarthrobacter sp. NPDC057355 TaxID=3346105 RepID=UPI003634E737